MEEEGVKKLYTLDDKQVYGVGVAKTTADAAELNGIEVVGTDCDRPEGAELPVARVEDRGLRCGRRVLRRHRRQQRGPAVQGPRRGDARRDPLGSGRRGRVDVHERPARGRRRPDVHHGRDDQPEGLRAQGPEVLRGLPGRSTTQKVVQPYAIYGFEAMDVILDSMERAGDSCNDRQAVIDEFFNTKGKEGVTGTYDIDEDGDVTLSQFGRYRIENGELTAGQDRSGQAGQQRQPARLVRFASRGPGERSPGPRLRSPLRIEGRHGGRHRRSAAHAASAPGDRGARGVWIDRYGLIVVLLALPVVCAIGDLSDADKLQFVNFNGPRSDLSRLASNLKDGLSNGAIWALIALGYTLVYGIIQLINFAHGDLFMIGSFTAVGPLRDGRPRRGQPGDRARGRPARRAGDHDDRLRRPQRDDRARRLPAVTQRAEARAADHGGRVLVHPPERRHPLARRLPAGGARPDPLAEGARSRSPACRSRRATSWRSPRPSRCCSCSAPSSRGAAWARRCGRRPRTRRPRG